MLFPTYTAEPVQDGEREVTLRRVGDVQVAMAAYHVPAGSHPDFPAVAVLAHVARHAADRPSVQGAGRDEEGVVAFGAFAWPVPRARPAHLASDAPEGPVARRRRDDADRTVEDVAQEARRPRKR